MCKGAALIADVTGLYPMNLHTVGVATPAEKVQSAYARYLRCALHMPLGPTLSLYGLVLK